MRFAFVILVVVSCRLATIANAQSIQITDIPLPGSAGEILGSVSDVDFATHEVAAYLYIEGNGWWTKPTFGTPTVPINQDGSFMVDLGTGGLDGLASTYAVSVVPIGSTPPQMQNSNTLDLGESSIASTYQQRFGTNLPFAGRNWGIKEATAPVGPGGNIFSAAADDLWVDQDGLHLTIQNHGGQWQSTAVVLTENLGYGTYMFQTSSRQDILDANATFGEFTWDIFGDDTQIPAWPNREIDFEDTRWGDPQSATNAQTVVQPYFVPGALNEFTLPDLSDDADLTRFFTWSPESVEFFTLRGHHLPSDFPPEAVIDHYVFTEDISAGRVVPEPGRENFRFNLWLNGPAPSDNQPVEVVINDFQFVEQLAGDFNTDGQYDCLDLDSLVAVIAAFVNAVEFDLTGDGNVDDADLTAWLSEAGAANLPSGNSYLAGDANLDGTVDGVDFLLWNENKFANVAAWCSGDFNADGTVDGQDFVLWNANKFTTADGAGAVPEPQTAVLLFLALGAGSMIRSR